MTFIRPYLYKVACASCGGLTTLPIDILQTRLIINQPINIKITELKFMFIMCNIFAFQNIIYDFLNFIPNISLRCTLAGLTVSPGVIYFKIKNNYIRLYKYPIYKYFIIFTIIREILFYNILYNLYISNFKYNKILAPLIANIFSYPIKILNVKYSYNIININNKNLLISTIIEILKSALGDGISLFLIYKI